ncbi:hypothetical protein CROQUDRAFT_664152, partial [Cronartium quercuum f. sp. fusiforme G11]
IRYKYLGSEVGRSGNLFNNQLWWIVAPLNEVSYAWNTDEVSGIPAGHLCNLSCGPCMLFISPTQ